jgi:transposase InsO family protein
MTDACWGCLDSTPTGTTPEDAVNRAYQHKHARLTPLGRAMLVQRSLAQPGTLPALAHGANISVRTARKWLARYRAEGPAGLVDRSSRPHRSPTALPRATRRRIARLRQHRRSSLYIAQHLQLPLATVVRTQRQLGLARLPRLEPLVPAVRYERARPGELLHLDIKKLGRIGSQGGVASHRITGARHYRTHTRGIGWEYLHVAIDDHTRLTYAELLPDEQQTSAVAFLVRAAAWFLAQGLPRIERVMTDNGGAYLSHAFRGAVATLGARHVRTRPYTPRTNGKAERLIQTLLREWAYVRPYRSSHFRQLALGRYLSFYNTQRRHTALGFRPPISRLTQ